MKFFFMPPCHFHLPPVNEESTRGINSLPFTYHHASCVHLPSLPNLSFHKFCIFRRGLQDLSIHMVGILCNKNKDNLLDIYGFQQTPKTKIRKRWQELAFDFYNSQEFHMHISFKTISIPTQVSHVQSVFLHTRIPIDIHSLTLVVLLCKSLKRQFIFLHMP